MTAIDKDVVGQRILLDQIVNARPESTPPTGKDGLMLAGTESQIRTSRTIPAGQVLDLLDINKDDVYLDLAGGPGTYSVPVTVRLPSGATVQSVQPARVTVTIRSK